MLGLKLLGMSRNDFELSHDLAQQFSAAGRGRLPVCVVRIRSWLRSMVFPPEVAALTPRLLAYARLGCNEHADRALPAHLLVRIHPELLQLAVQRAALHADELRGAADVAAEPQELRL